MDASSPNSLADIQALINDSLKKLDPELRDINQKVSQY
jgi:hypothetical protein